MPILAFVIGVCVLALASAVYMFVPGMVDDGPDFLWIVGGFFALYAASAVLVTLTTSPFSV